MTFCVAVIRQWRSLPSQICTAAILSVRWASRSAKKKEAVSQKAIFGRVGHSLKCGVVGVPNVGKSSFFNLLTNSNVPAANYPFCTIDPNDGRIAVPDERFDVLCDMFKPAKRTPAYMKVTDIAGLVQGASEGKGLGNAFLSHIGVVDAIYHLCRGFESDTISHVEGSVDPARDLEIIAQELRLKDLSYIEGWLAKTQLKKKKVDPLKKVEYDAMQEALRILSTGEKDIRSGDWSDGEIAVLNPHCLLTAKPAMYVLNVSKEEYLGGQYKYLREVQDYVDSVDDGAKVTPFSVEYEQEIVGNDAAKTKESAVPAVVHLGFTQLNLVSFFTVGEDEVRAWPVYGHTLAPQAAGRIHTDFEKTFIQAETVRYEDLKECGSESAAKTAGKMKRYGKEYVVQDGDVIHFRTGARKK